MPSSSNKQQQMRRLFQLTGGARTGWWRSLVLPVLMALVIALGSLPGSTQTLGIAVVVNDDVISIYDLESRMKMIIVTSNQKDTPQLRRRLSKQILNSLIDEKLKMQEAKRLDIKVDSDALEQAFGDMEASNNLPPGGLTDFLTKNGVDRLVLLDQIEATIAWAETINSLYRPQITIGEDEIDEVVNEIINSKGRPEYLASEIFIPINDPSKEREALNNASRILEQLRSGANFGALARNYSQSASAAVGGDLGWVRQGQLPQEIDKILIALKKGNVSAPVRSVAGYYLILKRNERIGQGLPPSQEKLDLRQVFLPLPQNSQQTDQAALVQKANAMAGTAKSCADMEKLEARSGSPLSGSLGVVDTSSLPSDIQLVLKDLAVSVPSKAIIADGGVKFLMICKRTGTTGLEIVRPQIKQRLIGERLANSARGHLRDLRQAAFLDIRI